ncbi:hypothetical protein [Cytobacillus sp. IB215665]|uniref:hypothetical protein n=1 Tax=Cytobacillus sp. IB215665 TaxID=3097357 RepID=UPI002A1509A6|nr:hypothetical protein [Cytobacillus sp. IB215665]MDX8367159.1 hypothetical protein [Cytobacillus sp. IB215665]
MKHKPIAPILFEEQKQPTVKRKTSTQRRTRFDKVAVMKFPVTEEQHVQLRRQYQFLKNRIDAGSITEFLTKLLRFGLKHPELIRRSIPYKNTGTYKTVKPNQIEKDMITDLSIEWGLSERQALQRVMVSVIGYLQRGGQIKNEEIQPYRPSK